MLPRNPYRSALLAIALVSLTIGVFAWFVGMATGGYLNQYSFDDDPVASIAAFVLAGQLIPGGSLAFLIWLAVGGVTWAIHAEGTGIADSDTPAS